MGNQRTFASMAWQAKGKVTQRERFLAEMDAVIPWSRLMGLIEPHYPKAGQGRQPLGLEKMLRIYPAIVPDQLGVWVACLAYVSVATCIGGAFISARAAHIRVILEESDQCAFSIAPGFLRGATMAFRTLQIERCWTARVNLAFGIICGGSFST
jgi:hypothetical protein